MAILSREESTTLLKKVLGFSKADECKVKISGSEGGNIRYARNSVSTSGSLSQTTMTIASVFGKKQGIITLNEYEDDSLAKGVLRSEELAGLAPENPEYMPFPGPQQYGPDTPSYISGTAAITSKQRTDLVGQSLNVAKERKLTAAGFIQNSAGFSAMMNSHGLFAYHSFTDVNFSVTLRTADGAGSGYAARGFNDIAKLDVLSATWIASEKAGRSLEAKAIEPGKYTVILEPAAGIVLLEAIYNGFDARSAEEGRSFLSKPDGKTKVGEKLVDERVTIYSDPSHPELPTSYYNDEGLPQEKISWIENGILKNVPCSRYWAQKTGKKAIPGPDGFIMTGGNSTLEEMIQSTQKGILVTRLWYIRPLDPQTLLCTGLTRDGTFYIENGRIKFPIKNFRFNESPIIMLNNLETLGKPERTVSGEGGPAALIPPMKIREFTFSSLSDAV